MSPEKLLELARECGFGWVTREMDKLAAAVRREALEEAAQVCKELQGQQHSGDGDRYWLAAFDCAVHIRSLKDAP